MEPYIRAKSQGSKSWQRAYGGTIRRRRYDKGEEEQDDEEAGEEEEEEEGEQQKYCSPDPKA